jgi:uncharacterized membrane protein YhaH (DUF805 family)
MNWYMEALSKYAQFEGRSRRMEYFMFVLVNTIISGVLGVLGTQMSALSYLGGLYSLAMIVPGLAVGARRMHDTGRSGWMQLIGIIPILGWIAVLIFVFEDGDPGTNQYGPNPKAGNVFA